MKIRSVQSEPFKTRTEMLCGFVFDGEKKVLGLSKTERSISHDIDQSIKDVAGKFGKTAIVPINGKSQPQRFMIIGLGKKDKMNNDTIRFASGKIAQKARELKLNEFTVICPPNSILKLKEAVTQIIEGCKLSLYKFEDFKSKKENKIPNLAIITPKHTNISKTIHTAETISDGVNYAKSLANLPPNECPPRKLAEIAKKLSVKNKLKCKIIQKSELKKKGFGGITAVGQGSKNEPRLIILEHKHGKSNEKPVVIVGKAVTFDTGGISLKPGEKMDEMKFDKCGGCNVLGIMKVVSELKLPMNVIGIVPSVENMPGGESYRPGDIIKLYSGKTAEILNTDAEGRLILADAIAYGEKHYSPKTIIDFATLTGACIVALGNNVAGIVSNDDNLSNKITESSDRTGEEVWRLPLNDDYMDMIKSEVADMKNMGIGRAAGTITAAAFLRNAVEKTPWLHFDIAGVAWKQQATKSKPYNSHGATGFGIRLVLDYLQHIKN